MSGGLGAIGVRLRSAPERVSWAPRRPETSRVRLVGLGGAVSHPERLGVRASARTFPGDARRLFLLGSLVARQRVVKPALFADHALAVAGAEVALVYQALTVAADDGGVALADPEQLNTEFFVAWPTVTAGTVAEALGALQRIGRVSLYAIDHTLYASLLYFSSEQSIQRPSRFRHPRGGTPVPNLEAWLKAERFQLELPAAPEPVVAPVTNGNGHATSNGRKGKATWLTPYLEAWKRTFGGDLSPKRAAGALGALRTQHGDDEVLGRWEMYLRENAHKPEFANPQTFARTFGSWAAEDRTVLGHSDSEFFTAEEA